MTNIAWPSDLPRVLRVEGLGGRKKTAKVRTEMDAGPAKVRQRYTVATKEFTGSIMLTEAQRTRLDDFYTNVLGNGALRFVMRDPQTLEPAEFRFIDDYDEKACDGLWEVTMNLEKMNA